MKKTKKALASLAIAGMTLSMLPFNAFAASTVPTRLAGGTAAQTAVAIAEQTGWTGTAILASSASYGMVDALTSGPLATFLKAPILLQEPGAVLNADTKAELTKLNVKKVYVTSGTSVISQAVLDQMTGMGITVESLGGADRFETSVNIAKKMVALGAPVSKVAVAYGWLNQDALSIASIASASSSPILLTEKNALPASVQAFLAANTSVTASDVIGGTGVISDAVKAALPNATRHAGNTAYDTNNQVIQDFDASLTYGNVFVASGVTGIDALAGAPLAAASKSAIVLTDGTTSAAASFVHGKLTSDSVVTALGGTAVVPETVRTEVVNGPTQQGNLSVTSVSAISATDFKVVFNQAPADTSKVVFAVAQGTMPVTVSATWNAAKTEATLTSSAKFVAGDYTVDVKNDVTDLGTSTVAVTEQKVAKINITSTKLGVVNSTSGSVTTQTGYATYQIQDQYGVDITSTALANNVQFQTGVGDVTTKNGLLTITPSTGLNLLTFSGGITITGNDTNTGVSTTATLAATSQIGTLSNITLTTLTNADGKVLTAGDTTDVFYAGFTATDISGNPTTNYTLMKQGLILGTGDRLDQLTTSSPYVTATLVQDPTDSTKGLIKVVATSDTITVDMPVVITAMTWTGTTSQINTTLKKQAAVDSFTLYAPSESIASGESKTIPFSAVDQNGVALTKASDLSGVTFTHAIVSTNVDGTLSIKNEPVTNNGTTSVPEVISAMTPTGHYSSITINIQKPVVADTLSLDSSVMIGSLQAGGATETADFGWNNGGFSVKDQYGRVIDMTTAAASDYVIVPTSSDTSVITATAAYHDGSSSSGYLTTGKTEVTIASVGVGSATVRFDLYNKNDMTKVLDSKSQTFTSLKNDDIKDYTMDQLTAPIYIINGTATDPSGDTSVSPQEAGFEANPYIYGTTASGAKVVLAGNCIIGANSTSTDFTIFNGASGGGYQDLEIVANKLADPAKTESSAYIFVTVKGVDGKVHTTKTPITSSTAKPAAASVDVVAHTYVPGIDRTDDVITLTGNYSTLLGDTLAKFEYNPLNPAIGGQKGTQNIYFAPKDQYGTTASNMAQYYVVDSATHFANGAATMTVDSHGAITYGGTIVTGDYITVSASTTTGLVKTIRINFGAQVVVSQTVIDAVTAIITGAQTNTATLSNYTAAGITGVTSTNLTAVNNAVKADLALDKTTPSATTTTTNLPLIQNDVNSVTGSTVAATALAAVNAATSAATMQTALENTNLGLDLTAYNKLTSSNKTVVAGLVLTNMPGAGYTSQMAVQNQLNTQVGAKGVSAVISIASIAGVTAPVKGATPVATLADTAEYTAAITWSPSPATFAATTAYTATITITPKASFTLTGVAANYFTVAGATATNAAGSGVVAAVFPATLASDVSSPSFTMIAANNTATITLTGGTFKAGTIGATDFTFGGTDATALAAGTFNRVSDTVVTITGLTGLAGTNDTVLVKAATQATQASAVAVVASTITDVTSTPFTMIAANNTVTITLTGGTFKAGTIGASDFTFGGTDATALAAGTFTRVSDTVVTITGLTGLAGVNDTVLVKAATQSSQATSVAAVASTI